MASEISIFWFRRDLRIADNKGLSMALGSGKPVMPVFIFDDNIIDELPQDDARLSFIYSKLEEINDFLLSRQSSIKIYRGDPIEIWKRIFQDFKVSEVYLNNDYEPYSIERDGNVRKLLESKGVSFNTFKDQVIFEKDEVCKQDGKPYTVFTPYKNKWLNLFDREMTESLDAVNAPGFINTIYRFPSLKELGFIESNIKAVPYNLDVADTYEKTRNYPALTDGTSSLSPFLRFGTVSIRHIIGRLSQGNTSLLNELVWREFFMQILFHFPEVVSNNFKRKYDGIAWRNREEEFELWCKGQTGYPIVDAGMRQLNQTGLMHNRVRMITAGFLCKHLLIDWRWGEAYFAEKLLDYELSSNNGNWQWAAGTGCDAAPYFRVFNPLEQVRKFDKDHEYVKRWIPELYTPEYPDPVVDHRFARNRAIEVYKKGLQDR